MIQKKENMVKSVGESTKGKYFSFYGYLNKRPQEAILNKRR